jgi:hypothetical protein
LSEKHYRGWKLQRRPKGSHTACSWIPDRDPFGAFVIHWMLRSGQCRSIGSVVLRSGAPGSPPGIFKDFGPASPPRWWLASGGYHALTLRFHRCIVCGDLSIVRHVRAIKSSQGVLGHRPFDQLLFFPMSGRYATGYRKVHFCAYGENVSSL